MYCPDNSYFTKNLGLKYGLAPNSTIVAQLSTADKDDKASITFLECGNATGTENMALSIIGK